MSTYSKYIEYAKAAIGELKQLETLKKSHKGAKLAQAIKEKGLKKITKSHVDSVLHGLGKNSNYSPLTDNQKEIAKELQDIGEKVALTHKDKAIAGILEKVSIDTLKLGMVQEMLTQENDLKAVITAITNLKKDPNHYNISELTYKQWMDSNSTGVGDEDHPINRDNPHVNKLKAENAEMAQSDITKIIDYSEKLRSMFNVNDNLEDWVKAKLNHACDYVATVRDYLKFYSEEKAKGTQNIEEKWTNAYKKSIDCSNAKGFSQKAHCRARQLRKAGKHTKSKPVKESYKEAIQELLKEQNSSMAMGALKQLNSDAKELQSMLQPNTQLEDWVKSKLNLAGEYLDDVYHHLDHFGPQGRKLDEGYYEDQERRQRERMLRFNTTISPEKKYWFKPDGTVVEAGYSHEEWIRKNDPSLVGPTLVDTYDNAVKKGYIRAVLDLNHNFLTLSNMQNYDFSMNGDANKNIPAVNSSVKNSIKDFIAEKGILLTATGKGKIIKDLSSLDENQITEDWKKTLATTALAAATAFGSPDVQGAPVPSKPETTVVSQIKQPYTVEEVVAATLVDEAGGEKNPTDGMHAVLNVIMNRSKGNIRQAAIECLKPKQFSGWNKVNKKDAESIKQFIDSKRSHTQFKNALSLVDKAKSGSLKDITKGANHFLNIQLTKQQRKGGNLPSWYDSSKVVADFGKHTFLKLQ
jgi:hypothetical protein